MSFLGEIKRRKVFHVAAVYAVVAWLLVQIVVSVEAPLSLPEWTDTLVIVLLAIGFVVALLLAWAYEVTPQGIVHTSSVPAEYEHSASARATGYVATAILAAFIGALSFWFLGRDTDAQWLLNEAIPNIEASLDVADWDRLTSLRAFK